MMMMMMLLLTNTLDSIDNADCKSELKIIIMNNASEIFL